MTTSSTLDYISTLLVLNRDDFYDRTGKVVVFFVVVVVFF